MIKASTMFIIIAIGAFIANIYYHEAAHQEVFAEYGIDSRVEYFSHFPDVMTIAEAPCPTEECSLANRNVDSFGYQLTGLYVIAMFGFFFLLLVMEDREEAKNYDDEFRRHKELLQYATQQ
jgi:disulfide bond formation protein DsbB